MRIKKQRGVFFPFSLFSFLKFVITTIEKLSSYTKANSKLYVNENIFDQAVSNEIISRINTLNVTSQPQWGTMNVGQMMAHCNVTYELTYENKLPKPNWLKRALLKLFVKNVVVGDKAYKQNSPTAPEFKISGTKDFEHEKKRLIAYITRTQEKGASYFEGRENHSFGDLTAKEWNAMFYKHLDHHLRQFSV